MDIQDKKQQNDYRKLKVMNKLAQFTYNKRKIYVSPCVDTELMINFIQ